MKLGDKVIKRVNNEVSKQNNDKLGYYEGKDEKTGTTLIAMQPFVADQAYMPQMKAMYVPFHMGYGSLIYSKGLQNDRPK